MKRGSFRGSKPAQSAITGAKSKQKIVLEVLDQWQPQSGRFGSPFSPRWVCSHSGMKRTPNRRRTPLGAERAGVRDASQARSDPSCEVGAHRRAQETGQGTHGFPLTPASEIRITEPSPYAPCLFSLQMQELPTTPWQSQPKDRSLLALGAWATMSIRLPSASLCRHSSCRRSPTRGRASMVHCTSRPSQS